MLDSWWELLSRSGIHQKIQTNCWTAIDTEWTPGTKRNILLIGISIGKIRDTAICHLILFKPMQNAKIQKGIIRAINMYTKLTQGPSRNISIGKNIGHRYELYHNGSMQFQIEWSLTSSIMQKQQLWGEDSSHLWGTNCPWQRTNAEKLWLAQENVNRCLWMCGNIFKWNCERKSWRRSAHRCDNYWPSPFGKISFLS